MPSNSMMNLTIPESRAPRSCWKSALAAMLGFALPAYAQQYGEKALRPNLSPEPCFRTEGGREKKRHADALVNHYRLYDFYRRQADHFLAHPTMQPILPPFPGLDGGRRGHWGATNEKETTALARKHSPEFSIVMSRSGEGDLYLRQGTAAGGGLVVLGMMKPGLKSAYAAAHISVPEHSFGAGADRFGMSLSVAGQPVWQGVENEWTRAGKPVAWFGGYHLHGDDSILVWEFDKVRVLEITAMISGQDGLGALARSFELQGAVPSDLCLALPLPSGATASPSIAITVARTSDGATLARSERDGRVVLHRIDCTPGADYEVTADGAVLKLLKAAAGTRFQVLSWVGAKDQAAQAQEWLQQKARERSAIRPSELLAGGPSRFGDEIKVAGLLNADPEATGTAYEIDDIPLPGNVPPYTAMTLSGLAFADDGTAYATTLVGDVWRITGLTGKLQDVRWKRYASGLNLPLGIQIVGGVPYVSTIPDVLRLIDLNGDGEADFYERFSRQPVPGAGQSGRDLQRDDAGNFYTNTNSGIWRISADGSSIDRVGSGSRNPLGLAVRSDGLVISDSSEGESENGTCTLYESAHPENTSTVAKRNRLLYLPRGVDNSPGSRLFLKEPRFGPLGQSLIGLSYGYGTWYALLRDVVDGTPQAALLPQPGLFLSGSSRLAVQPVDGQVFVTGLDGWGDHGVAEGCLHRLRYTGRIDTRITGWRAHRNGIRLDFSAPLSGKAAVAQAYFVQQWNYIDSQKTYGSLEMSVKQPEKPGHDRLAVQRAILSADRKSVFLEIPEILPAMCTQVRASLVDDAGGKVEVDMYATLQRLDAEPHGTVITAPTRPIRLEVPAIASNGDTYQKMIEHFDRLAGRVPIQRPVTPDPPFVPEEVNYTWIKQHLLTPSCLMCHGTGTQHDYTSYQGLKAKVRLDAPEKSPLLGMIQSGSMPPYPLPTISPAMQKALLEWVRRGAPEG